MAGRKPLATLIGDVVGSRRVARRRVLQDALDAALTRVNDELEPAVPLRITVGDEYQGCFLTVGQALAATLRLRLALAGLADVRHGIGWGDVEVFQTAPRVEDGPGWWAARAAIEDVELRGGRARSRTLRTKYERASEDSARTGPDPAPVNAALVLRDAMLAGLKPESLSVLDGLIRGVPRIDIAHRLGVTPSAVGQRIRGNALASIVAADELLRDVQ